MEILVPAAGLSTRYPNMRPKYLLYDYKGELMLKNAVAPFIGTEHNITVGILREHADEFNALEHIKNAIPNANVIIFDERTKGPADTIFQMLKWFGDEDFDFLVKDCDSFFDHKVFTGRVNYICVSNIADHETLTRLSSKSFVKCNDQDIITDIIEKQVVSDTFCVGGYKFESANLFKQTYLSIYENIREVFVSHVIQKMLMNGKTFTISPVSNYVDVGTFAEWEAYNDKPVIFCDIDGTLIKAQSRFGDYNYESDPIPLKENVKKIREYFDKGAQVFFVTAREPIYHKETDAMLQKLGFKDAFLIMGLNNAARILINDYNEANPHPRAIAYNIKRDSDNLKDIMR